MSEPAIVVIGAGAAGLMAAIHAAGTGRRVLLLERTRDGGRKILISGGGRCNILPSVAQPARFVTDSPRPLLRHILSGWPLEDQRRFFETELGLPLVLEPETGKLFPAANRARVVRDRLVAEAVRRGADLRFGVTVSALERLETGAWRLSVEGGAPVEASRVILATGGLSVPSTGSDGRGLSWLERLGLRVHAPYPALTPLTGESSAHQALAGVSLPVTIRAPGARPPLQATGGFLFTHRGWSGPAVLDVSHAAVRARLAGQAQPLLVAWASATEAEWQEWLRPAARQLASVLKEHLPERLASLLLAESGVAGGIALAQLRRGDRAKLLDLLVRYPLPWSGDEGYRKAEVSGGGLALDEVVPHTLECRRLPGLHVCGEALDAFGPIGGHNFQWAWTTGRGAGLGVR